MTLHQLKKGPNKGKGQIRDGKKLILECETYYEALLELRELRKAND